MKTAFNFFAFALFTGLICQTQTTVAQSQTEYTVVCRTANSDVLVRSMKGHSQGGMVISQVENVTRIATGLNYWDGVNWSPSDPAFQLTADGQYAFANKVQTRVRLSADLATSNSISITTPDGIVLDTAPVAVGLYDSASGNSLIIGTITNCTGTLISNDRILYENAFAGIAGDILYTVQRGSFSQDVIWKQNIDPMDYGFPTNSTRIQIFTAFNSPSPTEVARPVYVERNETFRAQMASPDFMDHTLKFGQLEFGPSRVVSTTATNGFEGAPIAKDFETIDGQSYLIESIEYNDIKSELQSLPHRALSRAARVRMAKNVRSHYPRLPAPHLFGRAAFEKKTGKGMLAKASHLKGVIVDYVALPASEPDPMVFQGNTTYFVDGLAEFDNVIFEGGAVIKYPNDTETLIQVDGHLTCETSQYLPAIFTAADDDSVGQTMDGIWTNYTGTIQPGGYANPAIDSPNNGFNLENVRFSDAQLAVWAENGGTVTVTNGQFINCVACCAIWDQGPPPPDNTPSLSFNNCLISGGCSLILDYSGPLAFYFNQCTVDSCSNLVDNDRGFQNPDSSFNAVNSIFCNIPNWGCDGSGDPENDLEYYFGPGNVSNDGFYNDAQATFGDSPITDTNFPFQAVGGGNYYLLDATFKRQGENSGMNELSTKTTWPPVVYSDTNISTATTLSSTIPRDTNSSPDLGYHYDPIDVAFRKVNVASNLTFTAGTVVAWLGSGSYGIALTNSATINFNGLVTAPCYAVSCDAVQEAGSVEGAAGGIVGNGSRSNDTSIASTVNAQFTRFVGLANDPNDVQDGASDTVFRPRHSEFWSGSEGGGAIELLATNCLFDSCDLFVQDSSSNNSAVSFENCTMHDNSLETVHAGGSTWSVWVQNCSFDGTTFSMDTNSTYWDYNAYLDGQSEFSGTHDVIVTTNFNWQSSWFGDFYLPTNSSLIQQGSTNANLLGLYHFTTQTNQVPDGTNIVTIGYHYVAADQFGNPLDSNGDGIPDYLQDPAGNGSGNWDVTMLLNVIITQPRSGSSIP